MAAEPSTPGPKRRAHLLATLGELIARNGAADFLCAPVAPGKAAFPEPWRATRGGVHALLRRLAWYADFDERAIVVEDRRLGKRATLQFEETRVPLREVRRHELVFELVAIGDDDIGGTLAHELGVAFAVENRPDKPDPYRSADPPALIVDPDVDHERGSIATVYLGLGVIAANAAYQHYTAPERPDGYAGLRYEVLSGGYVKMSDLAYLLAVQAVVRGEARPPAGLSAPQRDEAGAWIDALLPERAELCTQLGVDPAERGTARGPVAPFTDLDLEDDAAQTAFRWHTKRIGLGAMLGMVGGALMFLVAPELGLAGMFAGGLVGAARGRTVIATRCSACATVVGRAAQTCRKCGALLRGDIQSLSERLEAEERVRETGETEVNGEEHATPSPRDTATQVAESGE
ncbi:MAG: hypothetical protein KF773_28335 [Deltaproteobacteria bacterium]|nr:hypothetical protein [Deltaproteobacteria bacterium]